MRLVPTVSEHEALLAKAIAGLDRITPKNEYGFPLGVYRPDLLPLHDYEPEEASIDHLYKSLPTVQSSLIRGPLGVRASGTGVDDGVEEEFRNTDADKNDNDRQVIVDGVPSDIDDTMNDPLDGLEDAQLELHTPTNPVDRVGGFRRRDLVNAYVPLNYEEGFPALPNGQTYWDRFDFEPHDAYACFQAYLQMPSVCGGTRSVRDLPAIMVNNELLEVPAGTALEEYIHRFKNYMQVYGWALRARAFDLYRAAAYRKQMEHRAMDLQDSHFGSSSRLMHRLLRYMESEEDFWDMLTPKVGIDMFKTLAQIQRVSTGLPANAPASAASEEKTGEPFEMILRTLAQKGRSEEDLVGGEADNRLTSRILENEETTQIAQELILRLGQRQS